MAALGGHVSASPARGTTGNRGGQRGGGGAGPKPGEKEAWPRAGTRSVGRGSGGGSRRLGHAHSLAGPAPPRPSGPAGA